MERSILSQENVIFFWFQKKMQTRENTLKMGKKRANCVNIYNHKIYVSPRFSLQMVKG